MKRISDSKSHKSP